jgi:DNA invertase Pin-like site-specific DNA recombinase
VTKAENDRRTGIYVRISQDREGERWGVERQEQDCRKLAERLGWKVVDVYDDNDVSAYNQRKPRPAYRRMWADVQSGRIDAIITVHTDRLYRRMRDLVDIIDLMEMRDVIIKTTDSGDLELNTSAGREVAHHLAAAAQGASDRQGERIKRQKQQAAEAGRRHGGSRAFGWDLIKDTTGKVVNEVVNEDEAKIIRESADRLLLGASLRAVCRDLNERGVMTVSGKPWTSTTLKRMVLSPRVIGYRVYHGEGLVPNSLPEIMNSGIHAALKKILNDPERRTNRFYNKRYYLLSGGLLRCWRCGAVLVARPTGERKRSYVCMAPVPQPGPDGCRNGKLRVIAEPLEDHVAKMVMARYLESPALAQALADQGDAAAEQKSNLRRLEEIKESLRVNEDDYRVERLIDRDTYLKTKNKLETQRREVETKINAASGQRFLTNVPRDPDELKAMYESGNHEWRRAFIESLVDHVVVGPGVRGLNKFDPRRIKITYRA